MDATGQMYRRNRYYDPNSGRFTQEDPIGLAGGLNLYGFAAGDPVNFSDPFGLCPKKEREGVICIDLFIQAATVWGFRGDNRGFNPDADRTQSRAQIIVDPADIGRSGLLENKSCLAGGWCEPPNKSNSFIVIPGVNGSFTVEWDLKDGAAPYGLAPDIKGSITFTPDGSGGYETSGSVDRFPSWAIYQRTNGAWSELKRWNETTPFAMFDVWRNVNW